MLNEDDTATCDRCHVALPGYGVLHGMTAIGLNALKRTTGWIFCYVNGCRDAVLENQITTMNMDVCNRCSNPVVWSPAAALLCADDIDGVQRQLAFCHVNGCSTAVLGAAGL